MYPYHAPRKGRKIRAAGPISTERLLRRRRLNRFAEFGLSGGQMTAAELAQHGKVEELKASLVVELTAARDISAKAEGENRDFTEEERAKVAEHIEKARGIKGQLSQHQSDADMASTLASLGEGIEFKTGQTPQTPPAGGVGLGKGGSLGERFWASKTYQEWLRMNAGAAGTIHDQKKGLNSPPVTIGGLKALVTGADDASAGALVVNQRFPLVDLPQRPLTIRDLVTNGTTSSDTVEYARVTATDNQAAPVAEATAATGTTGTKPESGLTLLKVTEAVRTIAHWIPATKRALSDAGQIRTLIDTFLRFGLEEELEDQIVTGDGTGENFTGILNTSGVQAQAFDTDLLRTTRKARTKVRVTGRARPTAYVFHPTVWEAIDLLKDDQGRYYFGGPVEQGTPRLWGLPVVESEAMTTGTGLVADWRQAVLWDREQAAISVSDSHSDFFIRNLVAILAELRAAFGILRPTAFCTIDLTA